MLFMKAEQSMSIFFQTAGYQHLPAPCDLLSKFLVSLVSEHHAEDALSNTSLRCPHPVSKRALFCSASGWTSIGPLRVFDSRKLVEKHHPSTAWCLTQWIGYSFPHHLMGLMTIFLGICCSSPVAPASQRSDETTTFHYLMSAIRLLRPPSVLCVCLASPLDKRPP